MDVESTGDVVAERTLTGTDQPGDGPGDHKRHDEGQEQQKQRESPVVERVVEVEHRGPRSTLCRGGAQPGSTLLDDQAPVFDVEQPGRFGDLACLVGDDAQL